MIYLIVVPSKVDSYVSPSIGVDVKPDLFISTYVWNSSAVTEVVSKVNDTSNALDEEELNESEDHSTNESERVTTSSIKSISVKRPLTRPAGRFTIRNKARSKPAKSR